MIRRRGTAWMTRNTGVKEPHSRRDRAALWGAVGVRSQQCKRLRLIRDSQSFRSSVRIAGGAAVTWAIAAWGWDGAAADIRVLARHRARRRARVRLSRPRALLRG